MWKLPNLCFMCWPWRHPILLPCLCKARETVVPNRSLSKWITVHFKHMIYRVGIQARFFHGKSNDDLLHTATKPPRDSLLCVVPESILVHQRHYMLTAIITASNNYNTISSWNSRPCGEKKTNRSDTMWVLYELGDQNTCWIQDFHWIMLRIISSYILRTVVTNRCAQPYPFHKYNSYWYIQVLREYWTTYILICMSNTKGIKGISTL